MIKSLAGPMSPASDAPLASVREQRQAIEIGEKHRLWSDVLEQERPYWVYLPASYHDTTYPSQRYPVLYLLDGDHHFHAASGVVHQMLSGFQIPELIVIALPNIDRVRDLTPTFATREPTGDRPHVYASSGGGERFLKFVRDELFPAVETTYRTLPYRVLVGSSLAGLFALYALLDAPEMFQAYIAIDPSLWWDEQLLVRRAETGFKYACQRPASVYISAANNPSNAGWGDPRVLEANKRRFTAALASESGRGLRSTLHYFEAENHLSVYLPSLYYGLLYVFEAYRLPLGEILDQPAALNAHFVQLSKRLGVDLGPSGALVAFLGQLSLYQIQDADKAIAFFELNVSQFPRSASVLGMLGEAYVAKGEIAVAIESYEKALALDSESERMAERLRQLCDQRRQK